MKSFVFGKVQPSTWTLSSTYFWVSPIFIKKKIPATQPPTHPTGKVLGKHNWSQAKIIRTLKDSKVKYNQVVQDKCHSDIYPVNICYCYICPMSTCTVYEVISWATKFFFAAVWQNWDLRSFKEGPKQALFNRFD